MIYLYLTKKGLTMPETLVPTTDREIMFSLSNKIDMTNLNIERLCLTMDGVVKSLEKLETTRLKDHEERINKLEMWYSEVNGVYEFGMIVALGLSIVSAFVAFVK